MMAAGILMLIIAIILMFVGAFSDLGKDSQTAGLIVGIFAGICLAFSFCLTGPQFKDRTNEDFSVVTKQKPELKTEIIIKEKEIDTTYYYMFKNSTVTKE